MLILHQWRHITAIGEQDIIRRANYIILMEFCCALNTVAQGYLPVTNIDEAREYLESSGQGYISDEIQPNEIACEE